MIKFTAAELSHLLTLLKDAKDVGDYYGNCEQYWERHNKITEKLMAELKPDKEKNETGF